MRKYCKVIISFCFALLLLACSSDGPRMVPNDIFRKIMVETVFIEKYVLMETKMRKDTVDIYQPILDKYGYSIEDIRFTIEELASRKSDVVVVLIEEAIKEFEKETELAQFRADLKAKWVEIAKEKFEEVIYENNELVFVESLDSVYSGKYQVKIPIDRLGDYKITYLYKVDPRDENSMRYFQYRKIDSLTDRQVERRTAWMTVKDEFQKITETAKIKKFDDNANQILFELAVFGQNKKTQKEPFLYYDSVRVVFAMTDDEAAKRLMDDKTGMHSLNELVEQIKKDINEKDRIAFSNKWRGIDTSSDNNSEQ